MKDNENPSPVSNVMGIKPLAWKLNSETQTVAEVFFGRYIVERNPSDRWCWGLSFHGEQGVGLYHADNFEAAKVAAQADYQQRIMSAVEGHLSVGDVLETAARAGDAAVYEAMRSKTFDPSIPDNVAEFVGNAIRAASFSSLSGVENGPQAPTSNHVNGGAYRKVSAEEWRALGGDDNKFCDWHEGIGYVVYDDLALEQYLAKTGAITPTPAPRASE